MNPLYGAHAQPAGIKTSCCDLQGQPLLSPDGRVSLLVQSDGNLVLYNTQVAGRVGFSFASAIYFTGTYGASP